MTDLPRGIAIAPAAHGQGAFATLPHAAGALLGFYAGELLDAAAAAARPDKSYMYVLRETPRLVIDAADASKSTWARFINSPRGSAMGANVKFGRHVYDGEGGARVEIRAVRAIKAGQELLIGYGRSYAW